MKAIINIHDDLKGSWHQITVERSEGVEWPVGHIRMDGNLIRPLSETGKAVTRMVAEWDDEYEGRTDE